MSDDTTPQDPTPGVADALNEGFKAFLRTEHVSDFGQAMAGIVAAHFGCSSEAELMELINRGREALAEDAEIAAYMPEAFEDDPVAMALGFTPVKPGVKLPGTPEHCLQCALDALAALRESALSVAPEATGLTVESSGLDQAGPGGAVEVERRQDQPEPCNTAAPTITSASVAPEAPQ